MTPLFKKDELKKAGISIILHPLSAFRAMSKAALEVYSTISEDGNVEKILKKCNLEMNYMRFSTIIRTKKRRFIF